MWYAGPLCRKRVMQGVVCRPVVLNARCEQRDRMLGVVQIAARYAGRDPKCA
jgi:hypothetical protein